MLKVKIIDSVIKHKLEDELNEFLSTIKSEEVRNIVYDFSNYTVAIEYETEEAWKNMICADCQSWDDGNSISAFYECAIEPFAIALSEGMTKAMFTERERANGNEVIFTSNRLRFGHGHLS